MAKANGEKKMRRRNRWIVDRRFQFQFAAVLVLLQVNVGIFFHALLSFRVQQLAAEATSLKSFLAIELWRAGLPSMLLAALVTSIAVFVIGIRYSNQIVGPLPRIQGSLDQLAKGENPPRLKFRTGDVLEELATSVNRLADQIHPAPATEERHPSASESSSDESKEPEEVSVTT